MKKYGVGPKAKAKGAAWRKKIVTLLRQLKSALLKMLAKLAEVVIFYLVLMVMKRIVDLELVEIVVDLVKVLTS